MELIKCRHRIASVSPQPRHVVLKCLYRFDPTVKLGLVPECCTSMFTALGIGLIALCFFSGPKNCCRCQLSLRAPKLLCPVLHQAGQLTGTHTQFQTGVVRHAKWMGANDESDLTGSTSNDFSPFFSVS